MLNELLSSVVSSKMDNLHVRIIIPIDNIKKSMFI